MFDIQQYRRGTHEVSRDILHDIPVPPAGERTRWRGIQFGKLATTLVRRVEAAEIIVTGERWSVDRSGERLFGFLELDTSLIRVDFDQALLFDETGTMDRWRTGFDGFDPRIVQLRLGIVSSNDSSLSLKLCVFPILLVCRNGLTVEGGWIACSRKHTTGLQLVDAIDSGIHTFLDRAGRIGSTIEGLRQIDLSRQDRVEHLLVEAGRRSIVPWSSIGKVEKEFREPRHSEFEDRTAWSLYNAFTEVAKSFSMQKEMAVADRVRKLILAECARN